MHASRSCLTFFHSLPRSGSCLSSRALCIIHTCAPTLLHTSPSRLTHTHPCSRVHPETPGCLHSRRYLDFYLACALLFSLPYLTSPYFHFAESRFPPRLAFRVPLLVSALITNRVWVLNLARDLGLMMFFIFVLIKLLIYTRSAIAAMLAGHVVLLSRCPPACRRQRSHVHL